MKGLARLKHFWRPLLRGSLLADALGLAALGLLTVFPAPVWLGWVVGMVVPEIGVWLALAALVVATAAWLMRTGNRSVAALTVAVCAAACCLMLKPAAQAWQLGRTLPDQLSAAFETRSPVPTSHATTSPASPP